MTDHVDNTTSEEKAEQEAPKVVITLFPTTADFFGMSQNFKYAQYPPSKLPLKRPKTDDIRNELNRRKRRAIIDPKVRDKLGQLLSKYPESAEFNALDAILKYSDLQQSSSTDRFTAFESIVQTLGRAVNTHPYNINTVSWFLRIYSHYLDQLQLANAKKGYSIEGLSFHNAKKQILALKKLADKSNQEYDAFLSRFQNSSYFTNVISVNDIKLALKQVMEGNLEAEIGKQKVPASVIQGAYLKTNLALARIPILAHRVQENISLIKVGDGTEIVLQNDMIETTRLMSEYLFQAYRSDATERNNLLFLSSILKKCKSSIDRLKNPEKELAKEYEYDPLLKFALISIRIADFKVPTPTKKVYLEKSEEYLNRVVSYCSDASGIKQANQLINRINQILFRFKMESEEAEKQNQEKASPQEGS